MSNNNWKQYGGTYKSFKTFSIGNVVADDVLLRQKYSGEFEILGSITIQQNMIAKGIDVGDGIINRRQFLQLSLADTNNEFHIYTPTRFGNDNNLSTLSTDFITGSTQGIGINTTDISASLHILGRKIPTPEPENYNESRNHDLIVSSGQTRSSTIITQNSELSGIRAISDEVGSKIEFYGNSIYENLNNAGAAILFNKETNSLQFDTEQFSFGDSNQKKLFRYAYDTLGNSYNVFSGTALTCKSSEQTFGANSNTFFDITSSTSNGLAFVGGAFPLDPTNESFGLVGIRQNQGITLSNFQPTYSIISNKPNGIDDHTPIKRTRMGINSYNPKKDYTFSVNGKMRIENGEVNEIAFINIEPNRIVYDFHPSSNYKTKYFTGSTQGVPKSIDDISDGDNRYKLVSNTNYGSGDWTLTEIPLPGQIINTKFSVSSNVYYGTGSKLRVFAGGDNVVFENKNRTLVSSSDGIALNITGKNSSPYFKIIEADGGQSNFRYVESFLRVPDNVSYNTADSQIPASNDEYLILLLQEDIGLTYMVDFGRMRGIVENNVETGGSRTYAKNSAEYHGRNILYTGNITDQSNTFDISYSDISFSLVTIDALQDVSINQTIDASNNGEKGLFILGSRLVGSNEDFGFQHFKNTIEVISNPVITPTNNLAVQGQLIASKFGKSSEITIINSTREYFNMYICKNDRNYMVAVGDNIITYTTDGGANWDSHIASTILSSLQPNNPSPKLRGLEITDDGSEIFIVGDGTIMYNVDGSSNIANISSWNIIPYDILNINGAGDALTSANSKLIDIHKIDQDNYVVTRILQENLFVNFGSASNREGQISTIHIYVPNLFNRGTSDVLDICGNVLISGDLNFEYTSKLSSSSNKITVATQTNFIIEDALGVNVSEVTVGYNVEISGDISQNGVVHQF